jgi:hypothetical protein
VNIQYQLLTPSDAELLRSGIDVVYGDTYPIPEFYDPAYLQGAIDTGKVRSVVALNGNGELVVCMSTILEYPGDVAADGSALMLDRGARDRLRMQRYQANMV